MIPRVGRDASIVLAGDAISGIGTGLTLPFLLIYLHEVRDLSLPTAGFVVAAVSVGSLVGGPLSGRLIDRIGARTTLAMGLVLAAGGSFLLSVAHDTRQALVAAPITGFGFSTHMAALDALLAAVTAVDRRSTVFAMRHTTFNAGIGIGTVIAALIVHRSSPSSFVLVYRLDAVSFLLFLPALLFVRVARLEHEHASGGYREVLADRAFRALLALSVVLMAVGFGQVGSGFAGYVTRPGGPSPRVVAIALAANTATVVGAQLVSLRIMTGRTRTAAIRLASGGFMGAWLLTLVGGGLGSGLGATAAFVSAMIVFGVAETGIPLGLPALVNDLAPDHLRGRYNGLSGMSWTVGFVLAPLIAGPMLGAGAGRLLFTGLVVVLALVTVWTRRLERLLPAATNVI